MKNVKKKSVFQSKYWRTPYVIIGTFFYVIGGTVGDGIMSIPVELATTGFWPYFLIMIVPFITEVLAALIFIQILQKIRRYLTGESLDGSENVYYGKKSHLNIDHKGTDEEFRSKTEQSEDDDDDDDEDDDDDDDEDSNNNKGDDVSSHDDDDDKIFDPSQISTDASPSASLITEEEIEISEEEEVEEGGELTGTILSNDDDDDDEEEDFEEELDSEDVNTLREPLISKEDRDKSRFRDLRNGSNNNTVQENEEETRKRIQRALEASQFVPNAFVSDGVDLHTISRLYFNRYYCLLIDIFMIVKLIPGLYVIGLSQTLVTIFTNDVDTVGKVTQILSPIFCMLGFIIVYFLGFLIDPVISYASCFKSTLLVLVIFLGLFVFVPFESITDLTYFSRVYFVEVFLMQGSIFFIPNMFSKLKPTKCNMIWFQVAVVGGLTFSQVMSFLWCLSVWGVVPQNEDLASEEDEDINLLNSLENGELSNMPFTILLRRNNPSMVWVAYLVEIFTLISFTVSFLITTAVLKTVLDGLIKEIGGFAARRFKGEKVGKSKKKKIRACFSGIQISTYISLGIMNAILALIFAKNQFLLVEVGSWVCVLCYLCFLTVLTLLDIIYKPFRGIRIWCEFPRWVFVSIALLLATYYVVYTLYFMVYTTIKYVYYARGEEIPF